MPFLRYLMICLLCLPLTLFAADAPASKDDLEHAKEVIQLKLDNAQSGLQKDNQAFAGRLDSQDKRIEDYKSRIEDAKWRIDIASLFLAGVGILITILAVFASFIGYFSVKQKAREEATSVAEDITKKWLNDHQQELEKLMTDFQEKSQALIDQELEKLMTDLQEKSKALLDQKMESFLNEAKIRLDMLEQHASKQITEVAKNYPQRFLQTITANYISGFPAASSHTTSEDTPSAQQQVAQSLEKIPEAEYKFKDWNARAFAAYQAGDQDGAAHYWKQAAKSEDATEIQIAQSLYNAGFALNEQNHHTEAVAIHDQIIDRFGVAAEPAIRELVAKVMYNKGVTLGQLQRNEEAIVSYEQAISYFSNAADPTLREWEAKALLNKGVALAQFQRNDGAIVIFDLIISRFGDATELALREQVVKAMLSKGVVLSHLERSEDAVTTYDQLITRFSDASEAALRELVAEAANCKGFALLCLAKQDWDDQSVRNERLLHAQALFIQALEHSTNKGMVLGNQAYCAHLLGQAEPVRGLLHQALTQGGESLYQTALDTLAIHPVPADNESRTILDEVWAQVRAEPS